MEPTEIIRRPLEPEEHEALDRLGEALSAVLDRGVDPERLAKTQISSLLRNLCAAAKSALEAFGEDWSEEARQ